MQKICLDAVNTVDLDFRQEQQAIHRTEKSEAISKNSNKNHVNILGLKTFNVFLDLFWWLSGPISCDFWCDLLTAFLLHFGKHKTVPGSSLAKNLCHLLWDKSRL